MNKKFEIQPKKFEIESERSADLILDNNEFRVELKKGIFDSLCVEKKITPELRDAAWQHFVTINQQLAEMRQRVRANTTEWGSTDPIGAIHSELYCFRQDHPEFPDFTDEEVSEFVKNLESTQ